MSKRVLILSAALALCLSGGFSSLWARGFGGGGFHGGGGFGGFHGDDMGGFRGGDDFRGGDVRGFDGAGRDGAWAGDRAGADRFGAGAAPTRGDLNHFLGLPSDQGLHQLSGQRNFNNVRADQQQHQNWSNNVRNNLNHWDGYNAGWYADHPGAWAAAGWGADAAWNTATWGSLGTWFGGGWGEPVYYDYGNNIAYQGDQVYINGQDAESAGQYYDQVASQAAGGAEAEAPSDQQWLPLGVFALGQDDQPQTNAVIQLAINKQGIVRGNYTDTVSDQTSRVQGSLDQKTQRVAWTIGDNQSTVLETGLYNLTKPDAPVLVHDGPDRTQEWTLVRLSQDGQATDSTPAAPTPAPSAD